MSPDISGFGSITGYRSYIGLKKTDIDFFSHIARYRIQLLFICLHPLSIEESLNIHFAKGSNCSCPFILKKKICNFVIFLLLNTPRIF